VSTGKVQFACDTSVAVAAVDPNHVSHGPCRRVVLKHRPALAGHAAFETYAVLTRLPVALRLTGPQAAAVIRKTFPGDCWLEADHLKVLLPRLAELGIVGGAVYDALVGQAASVCDRTLLSRDTRAQRTYSSLGIKYRSVDADG